MQGGGQVSQGKRPTTRKCMHVNSSSRHVVPGGRLGTDKQWAVLRWWSVERCAMQSARHAANSSFPGRPWVQPTSLA